MANKANQQAQQTQANPKPKQPTWLLPDEVRNSRADWIFDHHDKVWFYYDFERSEYIVVKHDGRRFPHPAPPPPKEVARSSSATPSLTQAAQRKRSHSESSPPPIESDGTYRRKSMKLTKDANGADQHNHPNQAEEPSWYLPDSRWYKGEDWHFHYHLNKWFYYDYKHSKYILVASDGRKTCKPAKPPKAFATDAAAPASPPAQSRSQGVSAAGRVSPPPHPSRRQEQPVAPRSAPRLAHVSGRNSLGKPKLADSTPEPIQSSAAPKSDFSSVLRTSSPSRLATAAEIAEQIAAKSMAKMAGSEEAEQKPVWPES